MTCESNPFKSVTMRTPCGPGEIVVEAYTDGEVVDASLVRGHEVIRSLRPGQAHALQKLVEHLGEVVPHVELMRTSNRHTLRRDLRDIRGALTQLGLDLEVVVGAGYRLRGPQTNVPTIRVGDVDVDVAGRTLTRAGRSVTVGAHALSILLALADNTEEVSTLYRAVWGAEPHDVGDVVSARVRDLKGALRRIGSTMTVRPWVVYDAYWDRRVAYYVLRLPERELRYAFPREVYAGPFSISALEQLAMFDDIPAVALMKMTRRTKAKIVRSVRRNRLDRNDYAMVIE